MSDDQADLKKKKPIAYRATEVDIETRLHGEIAANLLTRISAIGRLQEEAASLYAMIHAAHEGTLHTMLRDYYEITRERITYEQEAARLEAKAQVARERGLDVDDLADSDFRSPPFPGLTPLESAPDFLNPEQRAAALGRVLN